MDPESGLKLFEEFLTFIGDNLQTVIYIILDNWVLMSLFGIQIVYLIINAIKLKRNTD